MIFNFNEFITEKRNPWTEKELREEVKKYKTRGEFQKSKKGAYLAARQMGILDDLFQNHENKGLKTKPNGYWTKDRLQEEVNKYLTRDDFRKYGNKSARHIAYKSGVINDLFKNHPNEGYADVEEWKENSYVIYVYELTELNKAYVGLTNDIVRRDREHLYDEKEKLIIFCKENDIALPKYKILEEDLKSFEAKKREHYWLEYYKDKGWEMININKPGSLGGSTLFWSNKKMQEAANKCKTRTEFSKKFPGAYDRALDKKMMDKLFQNHPNLGYENEKGKIKKLPPKYWTEERIKHEADKYLSIKDFKAANKNAYHAASNKGMLNILFYENPDKEDFKYTEEYLQNLANQYLTRDDFTKGNKKAAAAVIRRKLMNKLFQNHLNQGYKMKSYIKN